MNHNDNHLEVRNSFLTFDLGLASALITLGCDLAAVDKTNRSKAQFVFSRHVGIDQAIESYWRGDLLLSARHLFDAQKMLKNRLYSD